MSDGEKATAQKKKAVSKPKPEHGKYIDMIVEAITALKERNGSSRQAITKYIEANNKVGDNAKVHIKMALKRGVASATLTQPKGTGASGSFKVAKKAEPKKKPAAKKPAAKKPAAKKPAAKKTATKKKSPAKKKPAAKKTAAKKTPKKTSKKPAAKKPAAKKAKKTPKKAAKK